MAFKGLTFEMPKSDKGKRAQVRRTCGERAAMQNASPAIRCTRSATRAASQRRWQAKSAWRRLNHSRAASTRSSENDSESNVAEIGKIRKRQLCVALQPRPFEVRTRIGFTTRCDVRMTGERFDRVSPDECLDDLIERRILRVLERT